MELKRFLKIIKKDWKIITALVVVTGFSALFFDRIRPTNYKNVMSLTIIQSQEDQTQDYKYDNYYSQKAIELFSDSMEKWFRNPSLIGNIYEEAGFSAQRLTQNNLQSLIKARKLAPNYLEITYKTDNKEEGLKIATSVIKNLDKELSDLRQGKEIWFKIKYGNPYIVDNKINIYLLLPFSLLAGFILGIFIVLIKHYLKE